MRCARSPALSAPEPTKRNRRLFLTNLLIGALCLVGVGAHVTLIDYYNTLNITVYTWRPLESYYRQGFIPTFISSAQTIKPPVPEDYDMAKAEKLEKKLARRVRRDCRPRPSSAPMPRPNSPRKSPRLSPS